MLLGVNKLGVDNNSIGANDSGCSFVGTTAAAGGRPAQVSVVLCAGEPAEDTADAPPRSPGECARYCKSTK